MYKKNRPLPEEEELEEELFAGASEEGDPGKYKTELHYKLHFQLLFLHFCFVK